MSTQAAARRSTRTAAPQRPTLPTAPAHARVLATLLTGTGRVRRRDRPTRLRLLPPQRALQCLGTRSLHDATASAPGAACSRLRSIIDPLPDGGCRRARTRLAKPAGATQACVRSAPCALRRRTPRPCRCDPPAPPPCPCVPCARRGTAGCTRSKRRTPAPAPVIISQVRVGVGGKQSGDDLGVPCRRRRHERRGPAAQTHPRTCDRSRDRDRPGPTAARCAIRSQTYPPVSLVSRLAFAAISSSAACA